ncbi:MAG TPA: universal stress protein [Gemmatimonadales bacterium]|nr:universal stress protein [Gemmatimonadales bacterium]
MFHTILVPLDGSARAEAALPHAERLARAFDGTVRLIRVIPMRQRSGAVPMDIVDRLGEAEAHAYIEARLADLVARGVTAQGEVTGGAPAERVISAAQDCRANLIVLATHGSGGCTEFPLGGTAQKVIARAGTSVLIVPEGHMVAAGGGAIYRRVLVGVDGSRQGEQALAVAGELGRAEEAELELGYVLRVPEVVGPLPISAEHQALRTQLTVLDRATVQTYLEDAARRLGDSGRTVRTRIETAEDVAPALVRMAESEGADLIVLAARGASPDSGWADGAVATQMLVELRRPVLMLRGNRPERGTTRRSPGRYQSTASSGRFKV